MILLNIPVTHNINRDSLSVMQLLFQEFDDFLAFNKPFGVRTHKVADGQLGFIENLSENLGRELWVVHRLDKETSGVILFAKSKQAAADLAALFEAHQIKKTYLFLTDRPATATSFKIESYIEKQSEFFVNVDGKPANSETTLEFIEKVGDYFLWRALPKTGKPHQIRLHAQKAGISILGDDQHGGSWHHRLALHALKIELTLHQKNYVIENKAPLMTSLLEDGLYSRQNLFQIADGESYRLLHTESDEARADVFGDRLWIYDYSQKGLTTEAHQQVKDFAATQKLTPIVRHMLNRGEGVGGLEQSTLEAQSTASWTAAEEGVQYLFKTDSGFSPGLFLDQRQNRLWFRSQAQDKQVLNLFSYTSGFSVNAALGGAQAVTTVDVSKKFLEWSRENFKLNGLEPEKYEFFAQDTLLFLKGSVKRARKWDLIVCDPPSFGRSKDSVWKLEQNLPELAELLWSCLNKKGQILFTCNLEKRTREDIIQLFTKKLKGQHYSIQQMPQMSLDYECTDELKNLMKGFILKKG